mmetsp:Transcript_7266/g.18905  ORF Transcript_7266/g.18905 Transcript_7266/m.18905 type:complete len:200 (-) Transcript_7266:131-730(-)
MFHVSPGFGMVAPLCTWLLKANSTRCSCEPRASNTGRKARTAAKPARLAENASHFDTSVPGIFSVWFITRTTSLSAMPLRSTRASRLPKFLTSPTKACSAECPCASNLFFQLPGLRPMCACSALDDLQICLCEGESVFWHAFVQYLATPQPPHLMNTPGSPCALDPRHMTCVGLKRGSLGAVSSLTSPPLLLLSYFRLG